MFHIIADIITVIFITFILCGGTLTFLVGLASYRGGGDGTGTVGMTVGAIWQLTVILILWGVV
jgi:hypothetical protein